MELRHLRYFVAVGRSLSFTKAAELLHISQPPLSRQIQELEEELGAALFDRSGKRTRLTEAGEYFLVEAERSLEGIDSACRTAKTISEGSRTLNVGCVNFFFNARLAPYIEEMRRIVPVLKIDIKVMSTEAQERALMSGALDIGFVRAWIRESGLMFEPVAEEALALVFPSAMRLAGTTPAECLAELEGRPFIGVDRSMAAGLADTIANTCTKLNISPAASYECNDAFSIIGMVSSGLGWSIVPDLELGEAARAGIARLELPERIVIGMCYRKTGISEQVRDFISVARSFLAHRSSPGSATVP